MLTTFYPLFKTFHFTDFETLCVKSPFFLQLSPAKSKGEEFEKLDELKFSTSNDSSSHETALLNGVSKSPTSKDETVTSMVPTQSTSSTSHSRQSSLASSTTSNEARNQKISAGLGDCHRGLMVGLHRKMVKLFRNS